MGLWQYLSPYIKVKKKLSHQHKIGELTKTKTPLFKK
jgi:hypothetical protein